MKLYHINSEDSVRSFLKDLYQNYHQPFDPGDDLRLLKVENGSPFFKKQEGDYMDNTMTQCFIFCVLNDLSIYRIVNEVYSAIFKNKKVA